MIRQLLVLLPNVTTDKITWNVDQNALPSDQSSMNNSSLTNVGIVNVQSNMAFS